MARKSSARSNYIKLGWIGLGIIILFGIVVSIDDTFIEGFEAIPFTIPSTFTASELQTLALAQNFAIDCRVWVQGDIVDVQGTKTSIGFTTQVFNPQFQTLDIINPRTEQEVSSVDAQVRTRCDPGNISGVTFDGSFNSYILTGGTVTYYWTAEQCNNPPNCTDTNDIQITSPKTVNIPASNNVFQIPDAQGVQGGGVLIASPSIMGSTIDNQLTSTAEIYFTSASLIVDAHPEYEFRLGCDNFGCAVDQAEFGDVTLNAGIGTIKVFNQVVDPPQPKSQIVNLQELATDPSPAFSDTNFVDIEIRVRLPNWNSAEGSPTFDLIKPGGSKIATGVPITAKTLVDSSTNTYEFFITRLDVPKESSGEIKVGTWTVKVGHPARSGSDSGTFAILAEQNQDDPTKKVIEDPNCEQTNTCQDPRSQDDPKDDGNGEPFNFLSIGDLLKCIEGVGDGTQNSSCLNDSKFVPLYGIIVVIILLSVITGRRG